jgi:hypothetical protein
LIPNQILDECLNGIRKILYFLFNKILYYKVLTGYKKVSEIVPIPKSGKNKSKINSHRFIAKQSNIFKMFDTLINNKLNPYLLFLINDTQYYFRKGYSLYCQHIDIQTIIFNALNDPKVLAIDLVFLDLSNAFDTISIELLLEKLKNSGIRDDFLILIKICS